MKKVVVIGGGFAGAYCARNLEKDFHVTLIDNKDYFEFTPGVLRTIVEPAHIKKIQILHSHYLHHAEIIIGDVTEISEREVVVKGKKHSFDYLIICSGSSYSSPFKEKNIVSATRASELREVHKCVEKASNILIIGGGLVGVELAGELCTHYPGKKITIAHAVAELIERNPKKARNYAYKFLSSRGVNIVFNEFVEKAKGKSFVTNKGTKIPSDLTFMCTGIVPNFSFMEKNLSSSLNQKHQIIVNEFLQIKDHKNIFSAGDVNDRAVEKTAQNAERQARVVTNNIRALENKEKMEKYVDKKTPLVISLGKSHGIFVSNNFVITGIIPGIMKTFIEKEKMFRYRF
ncbi:FAD-dependent oxidoreductase [Candidatus Pacearchaeota archaeon]|nr:FAD-dependent oxidoreductase [Candidatus Pacearchaeota archaeon]